MSTNLIVNSLRATAVKNRLSEHLRTGDEIKLDLVLACLRVCRSAECAADAVGEVLVVCTRCGGEYLKPGRQCPYCGCCLTCG